MTSASVRQARVSQARGTAHAQRPTCARTLSGMWRPFLTLGLQLREPATEAAIATAERELVAVVAKELRELMLATDGVLDDYGHATVHLT